MTRAAKKKAKKKTAKKKAAKVAKVTKVTKKPVGPDLRHIAAPLRQFAIPTGDINLDPHNAREHGDRNQEAVEASLKAYGQRIPLIVQKQGMIVRAGNARLLAARDMGWRHIAAVIVDESDVEAAAYAVTANRTAELSRWNIMALAAQLERLATKPGSLDRLGFTATEVAALKGPPPPPAPSEIADVKVPRPPKSPVTKPGDLWQLGRHRVICAAPDEMMAWVRITRGPAGQPDHAAAVITDPPVAASQADELEPDSNLTPERIAANVVTRFEKTIDRVKTYTKPGAIWYVFAPAGRAFLAFGEALEAEDIWQQTIIWEKNAIVLGRCDYHYAHECIFYGWTPGQERGPVRHHLPPPTTDSVLTFDKPQASKGQPAMKPVGLIAELIARSTEQGDVIFDPFISSGSTLIAADQMGRRCFGLEADPSAVDVTVRRYQSLTGIAGERFNVKKEPQRGIRVT